MLETCSEMSDLVRCVTWTNTVICEEKMAWAGGGRGGGFELLAKQLSWVY
jgi:hypothetical protein